MQPYPFPNREGFFWAKLVTVNDEPKGEDWASLDWEVVQVCDNNGEGDEAFYVNVPGVPKLQWPKNLVWGPEVFKPSELTETTLQRQKRIAAIPTGMDRLFEVHMRPEYLDGMVAHVDAGGKLDHGNGTSLLEEVGRLRSVLRYLKDAVIIYWEPNTDRGAVNKATITSRLDMILGPPIRQWGEDK